MAKWISVKERLPSPVTSVIVVTRSGGVGEGFLEKGKWWWITECEVYVEVTHWMPLPEPPGEEVTLAAPKVDAVQVVRCKDCAVPHNKWTGCPKMNGTIMPPDGFCSYGERRADHAAQKEKPHAGPD